MARNRQRARERKQKLRRENVPGELDNASGEVEEAEAAIVAGAGGEPYDDDEQLEAEALDAGGAGGNAPPPEDDDEEDDDGDADEVAPLGPRAEAGPAPTKGRAIPRLLQFFRACWAELQRVQWPNRNQVGQGTAVVLGFVVLAGAFLGLADIVAEQVVEFII